jgi:hypothetical protein
VDIGVQKTKQAIALNEIISAKYNAEWPVL